MFFLSSCNIAISIKDADIAYGYILYNYKDLSPTDSSLQMALQSILPVLCGKETGLSGHQSILDFAN